MCPMNPACYGQTRGLPSRPERPGIDPEVLSRPSSSESLAWGADNLCYRSQRAGPPLDIPVHQLLVDGADGDGRRRLLVLRPPTDRLGVSLSPQRDLLRDVAQVSVMC